MKRQRTGRKGNDRAGRWRREGRPLLEAATMLSYSRKMKLAGHFSLNYETLALSTALMIMLFEGTSNYCRQFRPLTEVKLISQQTWLR